MPGFFSLEDGGRSIILGPMLHIRVTAGALYDCDVLATVYEQPPRYKSGRGNCPFPAINPEQPG